MRWQLFIRLEWPMMRSALPALASMIFMLCFTSFATVMALGGGPKSTTLEVAIYQAIRFDFDLPYAGMLALLQLFFCGSFLLLQYRFTPRASGIAAAGSSPFRFTTVGYAGVNLMLGIISTTTAGHYQQWCKQQTTQRLRLGTTLACHPDLTTDCHGRGAVIAAVYRKLAGHQPSPALTTAAPP